MKLLMDTHICLWLFREPKRLGRRTLRELTNEKNELWLSPINTWEVLTLHQRRKIKSRDDIAKWITNAGGPKRRPLHTKSLSPPGNFPSIKTRPTACSQPLHKSWT